MSDDWDFYFCRVNDSPASIFLDLGIARQAPLKELPVMAYVRIFMREPRADGLSSQAEFETLESLEDALGALQSDSQVVYVGRNTADGCRDLYFYARTQKGWEERVAQVMRAFPTYEFASGTRDDPDWKAYFDFLYPSAEDRERIQNRRTCEALERNGEAFEKERPVDHWAYFPDSGSRRKFLDEAARLGYSMVALIEPEMFGERFGVQLSCIGIPSFDNIDSLTLPLLRAAREHGGDYDGWEAQIVR